MASRTDNIDVVKFLLKKGASTEAKYENNMETPLHGAGNIEVVKLLLKRGADVKATNNSGKTPLHLACSAGKIILLNNGADIEAKDTHGKTPYKIAKQMGFKVSVNIPDASTSD